MAASDIRLIFKECFKDYTQAQISVSSDQVSAPEKVVGWSANTDFEVDHEDVPASSHIPCTSPAPLGVSNKASRALGIHSSDIRRPGKTVVDSTTQPTGKIRSTSYHRGLSDILGASENSTKASAVFLESPSRSNPDDISPQQDEFASSVLVLLEAYQEAHQTFVRATKDRKFQLDRYLETCNVCDGHEATVMKIRKAITLLQIQTSQAQVAEEVLAE
ncbi:hypothetical protein MMC32_008253 [Xylographa parallela]|nr:hypothetical protein [Xylographa parallela]